MSKRTRRAKRAQHPADAAWARVSKCWGRLDECETMLEEAASAYVDWGQKLQLALDFYAGIDVKTGAKLSRTAHAKRLAKDNGRVARQALKNRLPIGSCTTIV